MFDSKQRRGFSSLDLVTLIIVLGSAIALLFPAIQEEREASRRSQCVGNLKQIGLGIHNFHDIRNEICPSYLTTDPTAAGSCDIDGNATWCLLLLPFMEQTNAYELQDLRFAVTSDPPKATGADHARFRKTSIPTYFCPSRRSSPALTTDNVGTVGDYASVSNGEAQEKNSPVKLASPRTFDGAMVAARAYFRPDNTTTTSNDKPINGVAIGTLGAGDYRALTNFASVLDGLSNTAFIGEKAASKANLGQAKTEGAFQDGTVMFGTGKTVDSRTAPGVMAFWSRRLSQDKEGVPILSQKPQEENPDNRFGGWHPGITLFVQGDGAVRVVKNTESNTPLQRFGSRNDRQRFELQ